MKKKSIYYTVTALVLGGLFAIDEWLNGDDYYEDDPDDPYPDPGYPSGDGYCDLVIECLCNQTENYQQCVSQVNLLTEAACEAILQDAPQCLEQ